MGVSLEEAINCAGYDLSNVKDARWLLSKKDEWESLCEKADNLSDNYDDYLDCVEEMEDSGDKNHIVPFEEWLKNKKGE